MSAATPSAATPDDTPKAKRGSKRKLVLFAAPVLVLGGAAAWFLGPLPALLGLHAQAAPEAGQPGTPIFVDLPDIVTNLNSTSRRATFIKLKAKVEVARQEDAVALQGAMPRVVDLFQNYLREVRPEELRGTAGTYRLREELIGRINVAAAPAKVNDVLFVELLVQ